MWLYYLFQLGAMTQIYQCCCSWLLGGSFDDLYFSQLYFSHVYCWTMKLSYTPDLKSRH